MTFPEPWQVRTVPDGRWIRQKFGPLDVVVANFREEWRIATLPGGAAPDFPQEGEAAAVESELEWERWDRDASDSQLQFRPCYPNLSVVARPRSGLNLSPKGKATFFVGVPAWIEIVGECQGAMMRLTAVPTEVMSKTWSGSPLSGSLGYALKTYARRYFDPAEWPDHEIVCSIGIVNDGSDHLPFERLLLETQHLSVFTKNGRLWGNAARIRTDLQENNTSAVTYASRPAEPAEDAEEITPPREGARRKSTIHSAFSKVLGHFNPLGDPS